LHINRGSVGCPRLKLANRDAQPTLLTLDFAV
jgi:hypothetical protein